MTEKTDEKGDLSDERDVPVKIDLDPEEALRVLLRTKPRKRNGKSPTPR